MASLDSSSDYLIYHPEKAGFLQLLILLVFKKRLSDCTFVECSPSHKTKLELQRAKANWLVIVSIILQKILLLIEVPLRVFGAVYLFSFNLVYMNGGLLRLIYNILTCSVVIPDQESPGYQSFMGLVDGRMDLYQGSSMIINGPHMGGLIAAYSDGQLMDLTMLASRVAYENEAYVKNVVTNHWKMHFMGFYNFWNEYTKVCETQAFIFSDKSEDASLIVVAFRGTEIFNAKDWMTDVDLSFISMGKMGRAHLGFMKALGLQDFKDYVKGWPKNYSGNKPLAYYTIRETLKESLQQHKNAKILITGHSLGAALSALFPSVLILHEEKEIMDRMAGVLSYAQPRVGDETFGSYIESNMKWYYYRHVYRYDVVPRIPFDDPTSPYKHFGNCIYFTGWYHGKVIKELPDKNYFNLVYIPSQYYYAWKDLITSLFLGIKKGNDFQESLPSFLFRLIGLIIPGAASHSPRDYLNAVSLGKITISAKEMV